MEGSAILEVFRDLSYPLGVGSYDAYAIPRRAYIVAIEKNDAGLRISADVERIEKLQRSYAIVREPFGRSSAGTSRAEVLVCRYLVVATDGEVLIAGRGRLGEDGIFAVDLNGELLPGMYTHGRSLFGRKHHEPGHQAHILSSHGECRGLVSGEPRAVSWLWRGVSRRRTNGLLSLL